jgi:phosphohistidine phosphatase SixA
MKKYVAMLLCFSAIHMWSPLVQAQTQPSAAVGLEQNRANTDTQLLMIRHALAPGMGDPAHFNINDCSTQRNLSQEGIDQAKKFGQQLKELGFTPDKVWSSKWCRSFDTAKALNLGPVTLLPALNSYFQNRSVASQQIADLRQFILNLPPKGGRYVMVTHHVVIGDLTGSWVGSGDGVWLILTGNQANPWRIEPFSNEKPALAK